MKLNNYIAFFDYETGGKNPDTCAPLEIGCVIINPARLEIVANSEYRSYIKPVEGDVIEDEALRINHIKREDLSTFPEGSVVWKDFSDYLARYNVGKNQWGRPIPAGHNLEYDLTIYRRMCTRYGTVDKDGKANLFHVNQKLDTMVLSYCWLNGIIDGGLSMDNIRKYMGFSEQSKESSHTALGDVLDGANLLLRYIKLFKTLQNKIKFKDSFRDG